MNTTDTTPLPFYPDLTYNPINLTGGRAKRLPSMTRLGIPALPKGAYLLILGSNDGASWVKAMAFSGEYHPDYCPIFSEMDEFEDCLTFNEIKFLLLGAESHTVYEVGEKHPSTSLAGWGYLQPPTQ